MVRGPAAVLALAVTALGYFLVAPVLPAVRPLDLAIGVAATAGLAFTAALAVAPAPAVSAPFTLAPAVLGSGLLVAALNAAKAGAAASPFEALLFGCLGVTFAAALDAPALAFALPLFVGAVDLTGVLGDGPGNLLVQDARPGDPLTLELPAWGGGVPVARATIVEVLFLAAYTAYAYRFQLRPWASAAAMFVALAGAVVLGLVVDRSLPALALMSGAFLAVNADRLMRLHAPRRERGRLRRWTSPGLKRRRVTPPGGNVQGMDLEEHTLETVGDRCEECGAKLTQRELELVIESGGPALCTIHAAEVVPTSEEDAVDAGP